MIATRELAMLSQGYNDVITEVSTQSRDGCITSVNYVPSFPSNYRSVAPFFLQNHVQIPVNWTEVLSDPKISCIVFCDGDQVLPRFDVSVPPHARMFFVYSGSFTIPATTPVCQSIIEKRLLPICVGSGKEMADNLIATIFCEAHYEAKRNMTFIILSADRGFDMIVSNARLKNRNAIRICFPEQCSTSTLFSLRWQEL